MTEELDIKRENEDEDTHNFAPDQDSHEQVPEDLDEYLESFCSDDRDPVNRDLIGEVLKPIHERLDQIEANLQQFWREFESRTQTLEHYLQIVAECQRETAKFANNQFERHALYPAIEAVDVLARQVQDLLEQASSLPEGELFCPFVRPMVDSIKQAAQIAEAKCKSLDIEIIEPKGLDDLDSQKNEVKQAIPTNDPNQHKKIQRTLISGLLYRGKVLRQAQVSVYQYVEDREENRKENEHENYNKRKRQHSRY